MVTRRGVQLPKYQADSPHASGLQVFSSLVQEAEDNIHKSIFGHVNTDLGGVSEV